jgi:hypothetical protein
MTKTTSKYIEWIKEDYLKRSRVRFIGPDDYDWDYQFDYNVEITLPIPVFDKFNVVFIKTGDESFGKTRYMIFDSHLKDELKEKYGLTDGESLAVRKTIFDYYYNELKEYAVDIKECNPLKKARPFTLDFASGIGKTATMGINVRTGKVFNMEF